MGTSNVVEQRTLRRPSIQNVSLTGGVWKKTTVSDIKNKELLIQLRENKDLQISFDSSQTTYFTLKNGCSFSITSNMYADTDNLSFWVRCADNSTLELVEVAP